MLSTHPGERTSAHQTGFRPDLLPSGLYRRPRSFTGSWGLQTFCAPSADCTGCPSYPLACRFTFPDAHALSRALRTTPRGLYRRLGIGKARNPFLPSPCPEGRVITHEISTPLGLVCQETQRPNVHLRSDLRSSVLFSYNHWSFHFRFQCYSTNRMVDTPRRDSRRRGEPWAAGSVLGYASANIFDRLGVIDADPLIGPFLRGLPSLLLGVFLVWKHHTLDQLRPASSRYIGRRAILSFIWAGIISTLGLFLYYFAIRVGGVTVTIPVQETYVIWGTLIAWHFLGERIPRYAVVGVLLIFVGLVTLSWGQFRGHPVSPLWYWAIPLAFCTALTYGISGVLWRDGQLRGAHQSTAIFLQFATSVLVGLVGLIALGRGPALLGISRHSLLALLASGVLSGILAIYCLFTALRLMAVARVYAFSSLTPLVATLFAHFFLHEYLNGLVFGGVVLVSIGVILTQVFRPSEERQA